MTPSLRTFAARASTVFAVMSATSLLGACAQTLPSPPSSVAHHYSPASIGKGSTGLAAGGGGGGATFGPYVVYGEASARHGVGEHVDIGGRVTGAALLGGSLERPPRRGVYAARLFVHGEVVPRIFAVHGGIGGGGSAAGGYVSADVGFTLGYENRYVVPFLTGQMFASVPVTKNTLDLTTDNDDIALRVPYTGFGPLVSAGLRVPLGARDAPFGAITIGLDFVVLAGNPPETPGGVDVPYGITSGFLGYEHEIGGRALAAPQPTSAQVPTL